jgi:hypothetical protein
MAYVGEGHPKRKTARVVLSSVFGPFARDDEYGSRAVNPMELYRNPGDAGTRCLLAADVSPFPGPDVRDRGRERGSCSGRSA